ncbi:lipoprotein-releasing system ATP-binding protein LolD [Abditibacteriota bacterium]|nr:lipoprotein-releasing system ATP-binding protein LolD [Abditibacteriota bacterium]
MACVVFDAKRCDAGAGRTRLKLVGENFPAVSNDIKMETLSFAVEADGLTRIYKRGGEEVRALDGVSFRVRDGEFVSIVGASGSGKTTLLNLLGCMDAADRGTLRLAGHEVGAINERARTRLRRDHIGFVFQHFGLMPTLTVHENVALPGLFGRRIWPSRHQKSLDARADELLERVSLAHRRNHRPHELSGGEMQRVAIARSLLNTPRLLLADEPTGDLDSATGESIIELLQELNRDGLTILVVTHNTALAAIAEHQISLRDGRLIQDSTDQML